MPTWDVEISSVKKREVLKTPAGWLCSSRGRQIDCLPDRSDCTYSRQNVSNHILLARIASNIGSKLRNEIQLTNLRWWVWSWLISKNESYWLVVCKDDEIVALDDMLEMQGGRINRWQFLSEHTVLEFRALGVSNRKRVASSIAQCIIAGPHWWRSTTRRQLC